MSNPYERLKGVHDLTLPDWGPYTHDLLTCSHITNLEKGFKMDFFMVPAIYRRSILPPETLRETGNSPWEASADFSFYSMRQQIVPQNILYSETSYSKINDNYRLGRIEFVNNTDQVENASLFIYARFFPEKTVSPRLPEKSIWVDAVDYASLEFRHIRVDHNLVFNGARRGVEEYPDTVGGRCVGNPPNNKHEKCFGCDLGDHASWAYSFMNCTNGCIFLRARIKEGVTACFNFAVDEVEFPVEIKGTGDFAVYQIYTGKLRTDGYIGIYSNGIEEGIRIDGFAITPFCQSSEVSFVNTAVAAAPTSEPGPIPQSTVLKSEDGCHFLWWSRKAHEREYQINNLINVLSYSMAIRHPLYRPNEISGGVKGSEYCKEAYILPIAIPAGGKQIIYMVFGEGDKAPEGISLDETSLEAIYEREKKNAFPLPCTAFGSDYRFGIQLMSAALMTNIKFPIQCMGKNIRHHTPDKYYNSLYSWDSGFIGLGLLELDKLRAIENLNVYVTEPEDDNAFVIHGTPIPVQSYLYQEIWNRFQDKNMLEYFYPRLKHNYDFLAGHIDTSTCDKYRTHLLQTWDYFYNSGGWDDYPPQWTMYRDRIFNVAPAVTSTHVIRFAKTLRAAASILGKADDVASYDADINKYASALLKYSWNEEDGIFSYVIHDEDGNFKDIYRDPASGVNFNFGFDGVVPVLAGICSEEQQKLLWDRLQSPEHIWTPYGLTAVDQSAPYYTPDGYWNGAVWMPHQWFFWKSALDYGNADFARKIAMTALNIWKNETGKTFCTFEHFSAVNGRGCGCHHFGALSAPVLNWYNAYFTPGRLTGGMDCWIMSQSSEDGVFKAELSLNANSQKSTVLYVADKTDCSVTFNGQPVAFNNINGVLEITLPCKAKGILEIKA